MSARHVCKTYDMTPEQMLFCFNKTGTTADFYDICQHTEPPDCESIDLKYFVKKVLQVWWIRIYKILGTNQ